MNIFFTQKDSNSTVQLNYNSIMFLSAYKIDTNKYKLNYVLDVKINIDGYNGLVYSTCYIDEFTYNHICKYDFGTWINKRKFLNKRTFYYLYKTTKNKYYFKSTSLDNLLNVGEMNCYSHELLFKIFINSDYKINVLS